MKLVWQENCSYSHDCDLSLNGVKIKSSKHTLAEVTTLACRSVNAICPLIDLWQNSRWIWKWEGGISLIYLSTFSIVFGI